MAHKLTHTHTHWHTHVLINETDVQGQVLTRRWKLPCKHKSVCLSSGLDQWLVNRDRIFRRSPSWQLIKRVQLQSPSEKSPKCVPSLTQQHPSQASTLWKQLSHDSLPSSPQHTMNKNTTNWHESVALFLSLSLYLSLHHHRQLKCVVGVLFFFLHFVSKSLVW